jgi:HEAT repeat protein
VGAARADQERSALPPWDAKIGSYIEKLNSLKEGEGAVGKLIACGRSAIEPLRQYLLEGRPSVVYHSRRWAVEALAALGAKDVLLEYLKQKKDIADPALRLGEEAVESAAARELIRWPGEEVYQVLLGIAQERCLPGALEALGEFKRPEAVPHLVKALEDDVCRRAAEDALRKIGPPAEPDLIRAAVTPWPSRDAENPLSYLRRRSAVGLLAEIGVSAYQWRLLRPLLNDANAEMLVAAFKTAAAVGAAKDMASAGRRLLKVLTNADWYVKREIENALVDFFDAVKPIVERDIARRYRGADAESIIDPVLAILLRVKRRAERAPRTDKKGSHG